MLKCFLVGEGEKGDKKEDKKENLIKMSWC